MFPPPQPWKSLTPAQPDGTYVAFTSRFTLRSILQLPSFMRYSQQIMRQIEGAQGAMGYSVGGDILRLQLYTLSAWESDAHLQAFVQAAPHARAADAFRHGMGKPSVFVRWTVRGAELPLGWTDALRRQGAATR
jgi:hypothetical protein